MYVSHILYVAFYNKNTECLYEYVGCERQYLFAALCVPRVAVYWFFVCWLCFVSRFAEFRRVASAHKCV